MREGGETMTVKEWSERINGVEYPAYDLDIFNRDMKEDGIIAAYGYSDNLLEFRGVVHEETKAWEGNEGNTVLIASREKGTAFLFEKDVTQFSRKITAQMRRVTAVWHPEDLEACWKIETEIPHETFDIMEEGELFCRGVVFHVDDIKGNAP
jgi:hypothetical protein